MQRRNTILFQPPAGLYISTHHRLPITLTFPRAIALPDGSLPVAWAGYTPQAPSLARTADPALHDPMQKGRQILERKCQKQ